MPRGMSFAGIAASDHGRTSQTLGPVLGTIAHHCPYSPARRVADMDAQTSARYDGRTMRRDTHVASEHLARPSAESFVSHNAANSSTCDRP